MHVFAAQLKEIFGLRHLPKRSGAGYLFMVGNSMFFLFSENLQKIYDIFSNIHHTNLYTFSMAMTAILFLCLGKEVLKGMIFVKWFSFRSWIHGWSADSTWMCPFQLNSLWWCWPLLLPNFSTFIQILASKLLIKFPLGGYSSAEWFLAKHAEFRLPPPMVPKLSLMPSLLPDALGIAAVVIAVHISLAKMFAKKKDYRVDPSQVGKNLLKKTLFFRNCSPLAFPHHLPLLCPFIQSHAHLDAPWWMWKQAQKRNFPQFSQVPFCSQLSSTLAIGFAHCQWCEFYSFLFITYLCFPVHSVGHHCCSIERHFQEDHGLAHTLAPF